MTKRLLILMAMFLLPMKAATKVMKTTLVGSASWYGKTHEGRLMANGKPFHRMALTAAHRTLPLGTRIRVFNLENMQSVDVTVTDRGPYVGKRMLDLSEYAADRIGYLKKGLTRVMVVVLPQPQTI